MAMFSWGRVFLTGVPSVDEQHHKLVDLINGLGEKLQEGLLSEEDAAQVLAELRAYTAYHFGDEEALMQAKGVDPRHVSTHRRQHGEFIAELERMASSLADGTLDVVAWRTTLTFLTSWLVVHILVVDQNMARQLAALGAGASAAHAFEMGEHVADPHTEPLLAALHQLLGHITDRNRELLQLNLHLEERVNARTAELRALNERLVEIAATDALTKLPNRRYFLARLDEACCSADGVAVVMIDADYFKAINDTYGHHAGDEVLQALARCLREHVRTDDVVARLGGDEFAVLCPATDLEGAAVVAQGLLDAVLALRVAAGDGIWEGSVSVGVTARDSTTRDSMDLLRRADAALYEAKRLGRGRVVRSDALATPVV